MILSKDSRWAKSAGYGPMRGGNMIVQPVRPASVSMATGRKFNDDPNEMPTHDGTVPMIGKVDKAGRVCRYSAERISLWINPETLDTALIDHHYPIHGTQRVYLTFPELYVIMTKVMHDWSRKVMPPEYKSKTEQEAEKMEVKRLQRELKITELNNNISAMKEEIASQQRKYQQLQNELAALADHQDFNE